MKRKLDLIQDKIIHLKRQERNLNIVDVLDDLLKVLREMNSRMVTHQSPHRVKGYNFDDGTYR